LAEPLEVVFVGGVAHSGSSLVAGLLEAHPQLAPLSVAATFHTDARGLPALLAGQVGLDEFVARFHERWGSPAGRVGGSGDRSVIDGELTRFREAYHREPLSACRELFTSLAVPEDSAGGLVDTSAGNLRQAQTLVRIFPEARFVHVVRDGRDVAASPASPSAWPSFSRSFSGKLGHGRRVSLVAGIGSWASSLREIDAAIRGEEDGAAHPVRGDRLAVVVLDELVAGDREANYAGLLRLLELEDDPAMRAFRDERLGPREVGRGRWRERARGPAAWALGRRYRRTLGELQREENHAAGHLLQAYEELG
jgi:Sulfotransferase family